MQKVSGLHEGTAVFFISINGVFLLCKRDSRMKCPYGPARFECGGADLRSRKTKEAFRLIAWQAALREAKDRAVLLRFHPEPFSVSTNSHASCRCSWFLLRLGKIKS
jgi:hypothetical protein